MQLGDLFRSALGLHPPLPKVEVTGVAQDTRRADLKPGFVFVARRGTTDGHRFVAQALEKGAVAVVGKASEGEQRAFSWAGTVPYVQVENDQVALAKLSATFYGNPSGDLYTVGVTGTDGKTTTAYLLHHLLSGSYPTGLLSTAGVRVKGEELNPEGHFTTPEAPEVQRLLARFRDAGCSHAVLESSSHGLAMHRLDEVAYDVGVWTNLSPEHLDYHGSFQAYRAAKGELMARAAVSVLNADDPAFGYFAGRAGRVVCYGLGEADWRATNVRETPGGLSWLLLIGGASYPASLPMVGRYNLHNALAALAAAHEAGVPVETLLERLGSFPGVPGRMQVVQREPFAVIVDFAHTAPALEKALQAVRPQVTGRLIVLVGAAGERDPGKRAPLGETAARHADLAVFTEEDSRSEDPQVILETMAAGAVGAGGLRDRSFWLVPDRHDAIAKAVGMARTGDLVLLAGKGHERTLERRSETLPWNEVAEAIGALNAREGAPGRRAR